jgi:hypothetical protein
MIVSAVSQAFLNNDAPCDDHSVTVDIDINSSYELVLLVVV